MKYLLLIITLLCSVPVLAQTPRLSQYCILEAHDQMEGQSGLKLLTADPAKTGQTEEALQIVDFKYEADALNYLSSHGWELISVSARSFDGRGNSNGTRYYLRRTQP